MDRIDELLFEVLRLPDDRWSQGVEELCSLQSEHSAEIRRRFTVLRDLGLESVTPVTPPGDFPERLGDFRLKERLGGGGMGVVYLAEQLSLQRTVALKLVRPELLFFPKAKDRFQREVEAVARLSHPGIVAIHAVGEEQGIQFFAMEHIAGLSLEQALKALAGKTPERLTGADLARLLGSDDALFEGSWPDTCVRIARRIAEALGHAHARGVIHRDVKPSNVMLTRDGRVVLLDFGLAMAQGAGRVTRTGAQLGSLPYMAPEQVRGEHDRVDARSDVYSLGVTLYELLTLRSPFEAPSVETTRKNILLGSAPSVRLLNRQVSGDAAIVAATALDLDPRRRYQTAADFARDLDHLLDRCDIEARPPTLGRRARLWAQRHPAATVGLVAGVLLVLGTPTAITFAIAGQRDRALAAEDLALRNAYAANLTAAANALQIGNALEARRRHELCPPALRGWEWGHLALRLDASLTTMRGHHDAVTATTLSADARLGASGAQDGEVIVWDTSSGAALHRLQASWAGIVAVVFDPEAKRVHVADQAGGVAVFDRVTGAQLAALPGNRETFMAAAIAPDASAIWRNRGGWQLQELEPLTLATRRELHLAQADLAPATRLTLVGNLLVADLPNGPSIWELGRGEYQHRRRFDRRGTASAFAVDHARLRGARAFENGCVVLFGLGNEGDELQIDLSGTVARGLAFSPEGDLLAVAGRDGSVRVFDAATGRSLATLLGHTGSVNAVACASRDISFLLTGSADGTVKFWSALTTPAVTTLSRHGSVLAASVDGARLFSGSHDGSACLWDAKVGTPLHLLHGLYHWVNSIDASPDGTTILIGSMSTAFLQAATDGALRQRLDVGPGLVRRCTYSRDGSRFASGHEDGDVRIWDTASRRMLHDLHGHSNRIRGLAFGQGNDLVFTGCQDGRVRRWDLAAGTEATTLFEGKSTRAFVVTPDGRWLISAHDDGLRCFDAATGVCRWEHLHPEPLHSVAVLPDGSRILTGGRDGTLTFWAPDSGEPMLNFHAHDSVIPAIACDPSGTWCATASEDGKIRIWRTLAAGAATPAPDETSLFIQVALHHCHELVSREIMVEPALRAAKVHPGWTPAMRAKVCELLPLHGGSGSWPAQSIAYELLCHPTPGPAELERARTLLTAALPVAQGTLGQAAVMLLHYRSGRLAQAAEAAAQILDSEPQDLGDGARAAVLGTRAMALHRLGQTATAQVLLAQLRALSKTSGGAVDMVVLAFLAETEATLQR